jgi:putative hemolysin
MEILIIIGLILLNGIFSMSEMSVVASKKYKLEKAKKKGKNGANVALSLSEKPTYFLSTVQIGIIFSGDKLTEDLTKYIAKFSSLAYYAEEIAVGTIVVLITYLSIVLGELVPKRLGMAYPEQIAIIIAKPMQLLSILARPFVLLLAVSNDVILKIFRIKNIDNQSITEDEIKSIIKESADTGEIQNIEQDIVQRVFELGDRKVNTLFTHKSSIVYLNLEDSFELIKKKINDEKHSAYPVCKDDNIDDIVGIIIIKDLFVDFNEEKFDLTNYIKPALFINENMSAYKVLERFKKDRMHYGIVLDEFGSTIGIVTMDDIVDALLGSVTDHSQTEFEVVQRDDFSWLVDGHYAAADFIKYFDLELKQNDKYTTVAGLFIHKFDSLPSIGDKINLENYILEVMDKDGQKIDKLLITKIPV